MPSCILHIGHAKTASTYLQHCLHLNADLLLRHGYWLPAHFAQFGFYDLDTLSQQGYPISGNLAPAHKLLTEGPGDALPAMVDYLLTAPRKRPTNVLLSSELFFYYPSQLAILVEMARARGYRPEIIAYVARQDQAAIANYLQYVRNNAYPDGPVDFLQHDDFIRYCNYLCAMDRLAAAAPGAAITLRTFHPDFLVAGDILADFLAAIACRIPPGDFVRPAAGSNAGLLLEQYELLRAASLLRRPDAAQRLRSISAALTPELRSRVHAYYYRPPLRDFLEQHYIPQNAPLLERYMPTASLAVGAYWQNTAEPGPQVAIDDQIFAALSRMAFA